MNSVDGVSSKPAANGGPRTRWLSLARVLLAIAIAGAAYLAWVAITKGPLAGCGPGSGCSKVLQSRWAYWLNLPVSLPALLVYAALLGATVLARKRTTPDSERGTWAAIVALSVIVTGAALWFVGLQVFVIGAFCPFCMVAHACGLGAALICLANIPLATDPATPMWSAAPDKRGVPKSAVLLLALIGLGGVVVLAGGQWLMQKERNVVKDLTAPPVPATNASAGARSASATNGPRAASAAPLLSPNARLVAPGVLSLYDDQFLVRLEEMPMIGSPGASNAIVYLFDYTCPHCRDLHEILVAAQRQYSNQLGIVALPVAMSTNCNPYLTPAYRYNKSACDYVRLALAVWRAQPEAHRAFEDWLLTPKELVSVEEAREYADQVVGREKLDWALADPWVEEQIRRGCEIHYMNWQATERPSMPQLILGGAVSIGPLNSVEHFLILLQRYVGLDSGLNDFGRQPTPNR